MNIKEKYIPNTREKRIFVISLLSLLILVIYMYYVKEGIFAIGDKNYYKGILLNYILTFILFFLIPVLIIKLILKESLFDYGLCLGDIKKGVKITFISMLIILPFLYLNSFNKEFQMEYPLWRNAGVSIMMFLIWELTNIIYYISWEFFFRGFIGMGMEKITGYTTAIMLQTIPSTIIHYGKPERETFSAIIGGIAFGIIAYETRSILYPLLIHWFAGMITDLFCIINKG